MSQDGSPARDGLWSARHRSLTLGLVLTITLVAFEALAVSTVMPIVAAELGDLSLYGWVFSAFFLGNLLGIVVIGGTVDRGGLVAPFVVGLVLFGIGLVGGGLAPSMPVLVAARFVQGLGAGAIPPIAYVAIGRSLHARLRAMMFATLSTAWVLPGVVGPAIAGFVGEHAGWRVVFLGLLPLIAIAGALTFRSLAEIPAPGRPDAVRAGAVSPRRDRVASAILVVVGAAIATAGLTTASLVPGLPLVALGVAVGLPPFRRLTPRGTLRAAPGLPAAVLLRGVLTFAFFCADAYVPLALQDWRGTSAFESGIALTAATLTWTVGAWLQAGRIERHGARSFVRLGFATVTLGIVGFTAVLSPAVPLVPAIAAWAVAGLGMGFAYSALTLVVLAEAPGGEEAAATSGLQLSDVLGTALGTGVGGALIAAGQAAGTGLWVGLGAAYLVGAAVAIGGLATTGRLPARQGAALTLG